MKDAKTRLQEAGKIANINLPKGYRIECTDLKGCTPNLDCISIALHYKRDQLYYETSNSYAGAIRLLVTIKGIVYRLNMSNLLTN